MGKIELNLHEKLDLIIKNQIIIINALEGKKLEKEEENNKYTTTTK